MMRPSPRRQRGLTLLETLVTAAVLILGIGVVASTVVSIVRLNRRNLAQAQAYTLAEWWLERVTRMGCTGTEVSSACNDIKALDNSSRILYWSASGVPSTTAPTGEELSRPYTVTIDVDPPFEGNEKGVPQLKRSFVVPGSTESVTLTLTVNVRVTVSWQDEMNRGTSHAVALQTRVGP